MCDAFKFEKYLLRKLGMFNRTDNNILDNNTNFDISNEIGVWTVVAKTNNEILFEFSDPSGWIGATYLSIYENNENNINNDNNDKNVENIDNIDNFAWKVCFGSASIQPPQLPILSRVFTPFHSIYSRVLLVSTANKIKQNCQLLQ